MHILAHIIRKDFFLYLNWLAEKERELATFDENRREVGMLNPMRDKNEPTHRGEGTTPVTTHDLSRRSLRVKPHKRTSWAGKWKWFSSFHLDRVRPFWVLSSQRFLCPKCRQKLAILSFVGYVGEVDSHSRFGRYYLLRLLLLCMHFSYECWATVSASVCGWRDSSIRSFIRFLAGPARLWRYFTTKY